MSTVCKFGWFNNLQLPCHHLEKGQYFKRQIRSCCNMFVDIKLVHEIHKHLWFDCSVMLLYWWSNVESCLLFSALTIDTAGIATPPAYHGFSSSLFPENPSGNEPAVNLSALTSSMMGALSASINVPSSILSTGGEAGSSSTVSDEGAPAAATSTSNTQSGSAPTPEGLGGKAQM